MKTKHILLTVLLAVLLTVFLVSCGNNAKTDAPENTTGGDATVTTTGDTQGQQTENTTGQGQQTDTTTTSGGAVTTASSGGADTTVSTGAVTTASGTQVTTAVTTMPVPVASVTMPVFYINTENGAAIVSKEEYINGTLSTEYTDSKYALKDVTLEIRGRGNYSWSGTEKKSYRIKLTEKDNLLGQGNGKARSWTLLAVHCDKSLLRTAAAFNFASKLTNLPFTSSAGFVELYLNDEYQGVYQLSDQIQVNKNRVDIDDTGTQADTGFLVELDNGNASENEFIVKVGGYADTFEVKSEILNDEQLAFIRTYMRSVYTALITHDKDQISALIDVDSAVDAYIVEELFKNLDVGYGSFYYVKPAGEKISFGPVWDFDLCAGNAEPNNSWGYVDEVTQMFTSPEGLYAGVDSQNSQKSNAFILLNECDWFKELVKERWNSITKELNEIPEYLRTMRTKYGEAFDRNFEYWDITEKINREPYEILMLDTNEKQVEYLIEWLEARIIWLTNCFNGKIIIEPKPKPGTYVGSGGEGSVESPYLVSSAADFNEFTECMIAGNRFAGMYIKQTANIDMSGVSDYNGVGSAAMFAGTYDGCGYKINLKIAGADNCAFPYVSGTVVNVFTTGTVTNSAQAAGITRSVRADGMIVNCGSTVTVNSEGNYAGGISASNEMGGSIIGCWFGGTVNGARMSAPINCYIEGRTGTFIYNYYDGTIDGVPGNEDNAVASGNIAKLYAVLTENSENIARASGILEKELCKWKSESQRPVLTTK